MFFDCVSQMARPLKNIIVVSVTINGGIRRLRDGYAIRQTEQRSDGEHRARFHAGTATALPRSQPVSAFITNAPATLASAIVAVTDKSIPREISTKV